MTSAERFYLTTAIFYPSARPALHSLFEAIGADAIVRHRRMSGREQSGDPAGAGERSATAQPSMYKLGKTHQRRAKISPNVDG